MALVFGQTPPALVIRHVAVVNPASARIARDQSIVIRGNRIIAVAKASDVRVPGNARVIEGRGRYVVPGLWDMHVHLSAADFDALLQHGVTGVRDMGGDVDTLLALKRQNLMAGRPPRLLIAGLRLVGPPSRASRSSWVVATPDEARAAVDSLADLGVDFIKVHDNLPADAFAAIAEEARAKHLRFAGHVSVHVGPAMAAGMHQASIEHLEFMPKECMSMFAPQAPAQLPPGCMRDSLQLLFNSFARAHVALVPTISMFRAYVAADAYPIILMGFANLVPALRAARVNIMAGTDEESDRIAPGQSLHDELRLLNKAGFTATEVLQAATSNAARFLGATDSLGAVQTGKIADLIVVGSNPLRDLHWLDHIDVVIANGHVERNRR